MHVYMHECILIGMSVVSLPLHACVCCLHVNAIERKMKSSQYYAQQSKHTQKQKHKQIDESCVLRTCITVGALLG